MGLRDTLPAPREARERDSRIRGKQDIPDLGKDPIKNTLKDGGKFYFRLVSKEPKDLHEYVQFWINLGKKFNGDDITFPVVAPLPADTYYWKNDAGQRGGFQGLVPEKGCELSKLAQNRHPVIGLNKFKPTKKDGSPNHAIDRLYVIPIQLVEPVKDAAGKLMRDAKGAPMAKVIPNGMVFEMWTSLWEQFLDIIEPIPVDPTVNAAPEEDLTGSGAAPSTGGFQRMKPLKTLPAGVDPTTLVWSIHKAVIPQEPGKEKNRFDFRYIIDFSEKLVLDAKSIPAVNPPLPPYAELFTPITTAEIQTYLDRWKEKGYGTTAAPAGSAVASAPASAALPAGAVPPSGATPAAAPAGASAPAGQQPFDEEPF